MLGNRSMCFTFFSFQANFMRILFLSWNFGILSIFFSACWRETRTFYEEILQLPTLVPLPNICTGEVVTEVLQSSPRRMATLPSLGLLPDKHSVCGIRFLSDYITLNSLLTSSKIWLCNQYFGRSSTKI